MTKKKRDLTPQPWTNVSRLNMTRPKDMTALEKELLIGLTSGPLVEVTNREWAELCRDLRKRIAAGGKC